MQLVLVDTVYITLYCNILEVLWRCSTCNQKRSRMDLVDLIRSRVHAIGCVMVCEKSSEWVGVIVYLSLDCSQGFWLQTSSCREIFLRVPRVFSTREWIWACYKSCRTLFTLFQAFEVNGGTDTVCCHRVATGCQPSERQ